jgi:hypothetical protein
MIADGLNAYSRKVKNFLLASLEARNRSMQNGKGEKFFARSARE